MKLVIDLNDPEVQRQLQVAIEAKVGQMTAEHIRAQMDSLLDRRMEKLTEDRVLAVVREEAARLLKEYFNRDLYGRAKSDRVLADVAREILRGEILKDAH